MPLRSAHGVWFTGPRRIELREEQISAPVGDQVLVRARRSLISAGTEMVVYRGLTSADDRLPPTSEGTFPFPVKYGYQVVGEVVDVGPDSSFSLGDRVFARHPHQDYFLIRSLPELLVRLPDTLDDTSATFINLTRVALTALLDVPVRVGELAVVFGQGVVGMMCARLATLAGAKVVAVDPFPNRLELSRKWGITFAVAPEEVSATVAELSEGRGADVIYEASGAPAALQSAIEIAAIEGDVVALSLYGSRAVSLRLAPEFHYRRLKITSSQGGDQPRWDWKRRTGATIDALQRLSADSMVTSTVAFGEAATAYSAIDTSPESNLAVVLDYLA